METVTKRELNQHTAAVLGRVTDEGDVIVTERGAPRWRVSFFSGEETPLDRWERTGRYTPPATDPAPWPAAPGGPRYTGAQVDDLLDELRGDH